MRFDLNNSNKHSLNRYLKLVDSIKCLRVSTRGVYHHILPKSLFIEFSDLRVNTFNSLFCSDRQHFILHKLLSKIFTSTHHMSTALFLMSQTDKTLIRNNREYESVMKSYREGRAHFKHNERSKLLISKSVRERFASDPSLSAKISESLKGREVSDLTRMRSRERFNSGSNPMKLEKNKERMRGDVNVAKRPEVRSRISQGLKNLEIQPWRHYRQTQKTILVWSLAADIYNFIEKNGASSCKEIRKNFNIKNCTSLFNLRNKILGGWNPNIDKDWCDMFLQRQTTDKIIHAVRGELKC